MIYKAPGIMENIKKNAPLMHSRQTRSNMTARMTRQEHNMGWGILVMAFPGKDCNLHSMVEQ